jgi:flagellar hook-associated protein 2
MAGMNVGLISGMDTASLIDSLMQVEANPQKLLQNKLLGTQADAKAYREINTRFDALRSAAEALTRTATWGAATATSSAPGVVATATAGATAGSVTFTVQSLAARHSMVTEAEWVSPAAETTFVLANKDNPASSTSITLAAGATGTDAVAAINAGNSGITAAAINTGAGYRLQLTSMTTGSGGAFTLTGDVAFRTMAEGKDAVLSVSSGAPGAFAYEVTSTTNTFPDLMPGMTLNVTQQGGPVTVSVASDPDTVATAVGTLVKAANDVLSGIKSATSTTPGSAGVLKGDSTLRSLSSKVLEAVSHAVGGAGSAAQAGIQLDRYGAITFDAKAFGSALTSTPELAHRLVNGTGAGATAVPGVAQRLLAVAKNATDSTTGTLTLKAKSQDTLATDLQKRIDDWDIRLATRRATLERQYTAMESALSSLQNQSSWLSSQISSLPSWSASSKS